VVRHDGDRLVRDPYYRELSRGLYAFGIGVLRWAVRLEAYMLLLVDEFPPFTLDEPAA
jgi:hypothetical protein